MWEKQKKIMQWSSLALILLTGIIVWRVNYEIDFMMDDEWYSTLLYADTPIRNLGDIVHAQIWHYFNWGGRSMAHALLQMILLTGESWADILNTAMTFILAWRSADQTYNSMNFLVKGDVIFCGYGFTAEDDYLYQLDKNTGEVIDRLPLKKMPDLMAEKDDKLYVHTYSYDYEIEVQ